MKIVVGLGNPGQEYSTTRHNIGFITVDALADRWGVETWRRKFDALVTEYRIAGEPILLLKPQTYMNLSGQAVGAAFKWYKLTPEDLIVVYDDLDLPAGRIRVRPKGGAGGHRGIESLFDHLGDDGFARVRIGIGRPPKPMATADYVLGRFTQDEIPLIKPAIIRAADAVEAVIKYGVTKASNDFNGEG
jgi:PTH1 family peptidyl-tRNA hydrolase